MARERTNDQWTKYESPFVEEDGTAPFRYRVESRTKPLTWHLVDLTTRGGHGACDCIDFQMVANPNYRRHGKWIPYGPSREGRSECVHLRAAFDHYHLNVTVPMLARFKNGIPSHQ